MVTPIVSSKYWHLLQFCYVKVFSTNQMKIYCYWTTRLVVLEVRHRVLFVRYSGLILTAIWYIA
jgi:hypothetical protein